MLNLKSNHIHIQEQKEIGKLPKELRNMGNYYILVCRQPATDIEAAKLCDGSRTTTSETGCAKV